MSHPPSFDAIARPYRRLEYITFGRALERCRLHFLPQLGTRTRALVLGDGDGRFLACLLAANPRLTADAVDTSAAMLALVARRCNAASSRLVTHHTDALTLVCNLSEQVGEDRPGFDLVVTHFFLDCLTQVRVDALAVAISPCLTQGAFWLVSEFHIPSGPMRIPARMIVRSLYLAFRILTGLRVNRLPHHAASLTRAGFVRIGQHTSLFGLLTTELWAVSALPRLVPLE